jgi:hypothetical protein
MVQPTERHKALRMKLIEIIQEELKKGDIPAIEQLAIVSYTVGQMIALQDQTKFNRDSVMRIVIKNIEEGNRQAIAEFMNAPIAGRG